MKKLSELAIYILKQEFPQLSLTEDPDIERYFEFRALNRQAEALRLYNTKLKQKYPDDIVRVSLMTYYRKRDHRFHILLTDSLARLADDTIVQVKKTILFFTETITPLKKAQVYTVIQVCEKVITAISADRFAAIGFTEKYVRYAEKLQFREKSMREASDIIRMYITDTISSVREFREENIRRKSEEKKRKASRYATSVIDFSKITFTKAQVDAITIPATILRIEDKVLAYTIKYWDRYADGAFENIVLLYSRKYGTNHYNVFQAVKIGRVRRWKDEEILHAVLINVAQGYYYSMSGDLYLQRTWRQIRLKTVQSQKALSEPVTKQTKRIGTTRSKKQEEIKSKAKQETPVANFRQERVPIIQKAKEAVQEKDSVQAVVPLYSIQPQTQPPSIADMVKKSTGKSYGIYRDLFFKTVRASIRVILQYSAIQKQSFFGTAQNQAENIIYGFFEDHYDNPYQQWQDSAEQSAVLEQGFRIDSLEPIIRHWAKHNI